MLNVVLRFSALGDIVLTSAFIRSLEAPVIYVTNETFKKFVEEFMPHKQLKAYGVIKPKGLIAWFREGLVFANFLSHLVGASPNESIHIYDLHNVGKSTMFLWGVQWGLRSQSAINRIVIRKTQKYRFQRWLQILFKIEIPELKSRPMFQRHIELLEHVSRETPLLTHQNRIPLFVNGDRELKLLIAPDAQHHKKRWPPEYWNEVFAQLSKIQSIRITIKIVAQQRILDNVQKYFEGSSHIIEDLQGKTQLMDLAPLAAESQLCLCSNSAWLHISEAVGTPVVALAGPIVDEFGFSPWMKESKELSVKLKCRPCTFHGDGICINPNQIACMKEIKSQDLLANLWLSLGYRSAPE